MLLNKKAQRLGIFIFFDRDGIVDDYVTYLLKSLKEATDDLIIISNSYLAPLEKKKLNEFTDKVRIRHNIGLDAGAFKSAFDEFQDYFKTFDELLLVNDTFFGPFVPFKKICEDMETKDIDFWGLTANYDSVDGYGYLPDNMIHSHIQTFFVAFRNNVLNSEAFLNYWKNYQIKEMNNFHNVVTKHEIAFTYYLEQAGFKWDVYTNLEKYHGETLEENFNCYAYVAYDMIKNLNCPFIKRKNFVFDKKDSLYLVDGADARRALDYIKEKKLYDTEMIWKNLIRLYQPIDLYYGLDLNYIVSEKKNITKEYAILFLLENEKYLSTFIQIIKELNVENVFVYTNNEQIKNRVEKENIKWVNEETFESKKYAYICIVRDDYLKKQQIPAVYENNFYLVKKNGFDTPEYINGVMDTFENNKHIGLLTLPASMHSNYFEDYSNANNRIIVNENACWIKSELFDWNIINEFGFIHKLISQLNAYKYIFGKITNKEEAQYTLTNQEYILKEMLTALKKDHETITSTLSEALYHIRHTKCEISNKQKLKQLLIKIKNKL